MDLNTENATSQLGDLFQHIIYDMKRTMPVWEEFIVKSNKLNISLRSTVTSLSSFLDTLQKIADIATGARGATKDIGSGLTRLCLRHRNIENKLKAYSSSMLDAMISPIQEKLEEWKKSVLLLDKEHSKDHKKTKQELRKMSAEVISLKNKVRKGKTEAQGQLGDLLHDVKSKNLQFEEFEKSAVRSALVEERTRFCLFISCLKPVMDMEISVLTELTHVQEVVDSLCMQAGDPSCLPAASEQVIIDIQDTKRDWFCQTPPGTPMSKNSSFHSINSGQSSQSSDFSPLTVGSSDDLLLTQNVPFITGFSSTSDDFGYLGEDLQGFMASKSEKWTPSMRQRSWTGLTQIRSSRDRENATSKTFSPPAHTGSIRIPGRKKCPDIKMVDDLPFRSSIHAHSLPPTPNPYAVPSLLNRSEEDSSSLDKFCKNFPEKSISKEADQQQTTLDFDNLETASFDNESSFNAILKELNQSSATLMNLHPIESNIKHSDCIDVDELAAAMKELEWTTAMLDGLTDSNRNVSCDENTEKDLPQVSVNENDPSAQRNLSKPPTSGVLRRSSMQGTRKPPPPIRRTSSVAGSTQINFQSTPVASISGADKNSNTVSPDQVNNRRQEQLNSVPVMAVAMAEAYSASAKPSTSTASSIFLVGDGKDSHQGYARKIPRVNRTTSQGFIKNVPDDEKPPVGQKRKKYRLRLCVDTTLCVHG